jgi:hypothetical protein
MNVKADRIITHVYFSKKYNSRRTMLTRVVIKPTYNQGLIMISISPCGINGEVN